MAGFVLAPARAQAPGPEGHDVALVDHARAAHGMGGLVVAPDLTEVARRHAGRMAAAGRLYHNPDLGDEVAGWYRVGENVGVASSVDTIHELFMQSATHRANILGAFREIGVGVVVAGDRLYLVEVYRDPSNTASSPAPSPPPPPPPAPPPAPAPTTAPAPAPAPAMPTTAAPAITVTEPTITAPPVTSAPTTTTATTPPAAPTPELLFLALGESAATTTGLLDDLVEDVDPGRLRSVAGLAAAVLALVVAAQGLAVRRLGLA